MRREKRKLSSAIRNGVSVMTDLMKLDMRRRQLGMSRASLARRAKVSVPTVHRILTGKETGPSVATIEALASALGLVIKIVEAVDAEELRQRQAHMKASRLVGMVQATLGLES